MTAIIQYKLILMTRQVLLLPKNAKIRKLACIGRDRITLWAEVDTAQENEMRHFYIVGADEEMDEKIVKNYLDTVVMTDDIFVWHIYEILNP